MSTSVLWTVSDIAVYRAGFAAEKKHYVVTNDIEVSAPFASREDAANANVPWEDGWYIDHKRIVEPVENALHNVNTILERLCQKPYELYLTGKGNFRHELATLKTYKGNRARVGKPVHYDAIRDLMIRKWGAVVVDGQEADDEIGIRATELTKEGKSPIIVTIDKDLDMIPGLHYNWVKDELRQIDKLEAWRCFYKQCLMGDSTDNIPGIEGLGPKTADKLLAECKTAEQMLRVVKDQWHKHYPRGFQAETGATVQADNAREEVMKLLWIRRKREN